MLVCGSWCLLLAKVTTVSLLFFFFLFFSFDGIFLVVNFGLVRMKELNSKSTKCGLEHVVNLKVSNLRGHRCAQPHQHEHTWQKEGSQPLQLPAPLQVAEVQFLTMQILGMSKTT